MEGSVFSYTQTSLYANVVYLRPFSSFPAQCNDALPDEATVWFEDTQHIVDGEIIHSAEFQHKPQGTAIRNNNPSAMSRSFIYSSKFCRKSSCQEFHRERPCHKLYLKAIFSVLTESGRYGAVSSASRRLTEQAGTGKDRYLQVPRL